MIAPLLVAIASAEDAFAFGEFMGACEPDCKKCHQLSKQEAAEIVSKLNPQVEVVEVNLGPVKGLWEVVIQARDKRGIAYVDYSKKHILSGSIIDVATKENLTANKQNDLNRIDFASIPLEDALVMGKRDAPQRVVVFDDPD